MNNMKIWNESTASFAASNGINISEVIGTGPNDQITTQDVLLYMIKNGIDMKNAPAPVAAEPVAAEPVAAPMSEAQIREQMKSEIRNEIIASMGGVCVPPPAALVAAPIPEVKTGFWAKAKTPAIIVGAGMATVGVLAGIGWLCSD